MAGERAVEAGDGPVEHPAAPRANPIVPAAMRLLGDRNWWAPHPLRWLRRRAGRGEVGQALPEPAAER